MGQQQLLLVILVTIIVGIATVVAMNTFSAAAESATFDSVRIDLATIGASAQSHYIRPRMLGGGSRTFSNPPLTFQRFPFGGVINSDTEAENENAIYTISEVESQTVLIVATVKNPGNPEIQMRICPNNIIMGSINGTVPSDCGD